MTKKIIDFTTVREEYNVYDLENGFRLRLKIPITSVFNETIDNKTRGNFGLQIVSKVEVPDGFDTSNLKLTVEEVTDQDIVKKLEIIKRKEFVNIYETAKSFLIMGIHVNSISMTDKKIQDGSPALRFNYDTGMSSYPKPDWEKIQDTESKK